MLLSIAVAALVGATPCNLSLLAPAQPPARLQALSPATSLRGDCAELGASAAAPPPVWKLRSLGFLGGVVGSVAGAAGGALLGNAISSHCRGECYGSDGMVYGGLLGVPLGAALGMQLTGAALDGRGRWWGTLLGSLGGTLLGIATAMLIASEAPESDSSAYLLIPSLFMPAAGAVAGYELSSGSGSRALTLPSSTGGAAVPRAPMLRLRFDF